ncbi:MAG TPA: leucine--tRNA ligase [Ktedonobacterales bacterium]|jgi:leucyl-tRNA synthetase
MISSSSKRKRASKSSSKSQAASDAPRRARGPSYDIRAIEARWRERWEASGLYHVDLRAAKRPYYNLMMFPYPSAEGLHVGNMYSYIGSDIQGRWRAAQGFDVFEPMGFDAFGIHSENFAIKQGVHPRALTERNVRRFREEQLKRIGARFDWSAEVNTTDPRYYRWTQWIFTQLFKHGLAERRKAAVNWCPKDKTVLADEQVINGRCERCDSVIERRELEQWFLKITAYAEKLLRNLETLDWSERVKTAQRAWIGKSEGVEFAFCLADRSDGEIRVYTTRPDTIYGVTFVVVAPEHPATLELATEERREQVVVYRAGAQSRRAALDEEEGHDVTGVFTGAYAIHPLSGERLPIWVADYVLAEYGTGAIMATPAHDARDLAFAQAMGLPVREVVRPEVGSPPWDGDEAYTGRGVVCASGEFSGMTSDEAAWVVAERLEGMGVGQRRMNYHLRDWLISRQRYWGPPIPIIHCPTHGAVPVPDDQLPVLLPELEDYIPKATGDSPLARIPEFVETTCPICGGLARRDTDVMDNFLDSAWYYLRYPSKHDDQRAWDPEMTRKWLPVDMYVGGAEHSVLHLMYARFIAMAMHDLGYLDFEEPFKRFRANGMITRDGAKMSKSRGNLINPDEYLDVYGADVFRVYLLFMGPYEAGGDFSDRGIGGAVRFMDRVWRLITSRAESLLEETASGDARRAMHIAIRRVTEDIEALKYNTAIAALMEYTHTLEGAPATTRAEAQILLQLLSPFAPFVTEELWERFGADGSIHAQSWPEFDPQALAQATVEILVQVDGKLRDHMWIPADGDEAVARDAALASEKVQRAMDGAQVRGVKYVPGRLINIVTKG